LFPYTLNLRHSLVVTDQVSHTNKTRGKIIHKEMTAPWNLSFIFIKSLWFNLSGKKGDVLYFRALLCTERQTRSLQQGKKLLLQKPITVMYYGLLSHV